jgi:hypothetical protein
VRSSAAALLVALPLLGAAQEKPAEAKPAEKPAESKVTVTPYGFVLLNMYDDMGTFTTKDYPGQVARVDVGDAWLGSARQSRFGVRLSYDDKNWTKATLSGVVEFDFSGGQISSTAVGSSVPSTSWYNGIMRLRLASGTAAWKFNDENALSILFGQDYGLVNPLFAESLAWVAQPLFWQAGNLWRRSPQIRATYNLKTSVLGFQAAAAALSPADSATGAPYAVDYGAGNASGRPDLEGRVAFSLKFGDVGGTVGVGYHMEKRKYVTAAGAVEKELTTGLLGVDLDANITKFLQVKGEYYTGSGTDDTYNGPIQSTFGTGTARDTVDTTGFWAQGIVKPFDALWITGGYGEGRATGSVTSTAGTTARGSNSQLAFGILANAGKYWRFGVEFLKTTTKYGDGASFDANQIALSSMLRF